MQRALGSTESKSVSPSQGGSSSTTEKIPQQENILSYLKDRAEVPGLFWIIEDQRFIIYTSLSGSGQNCRLILPFLVPQDPTERNGSSSDLVSQPSAIEPRLSRSKRKKMAREACRQQTPFLPGEDLSAWIPQGSFTNNDEVKKFKRRSKKKSKKMKKTSAGIKSETSSYEGVRGSSVSACADGDLANEGPYIEHELPEITQGESDTEGNGISRVTQPETPNTVASHSDGVVASSSLVSSSVPKEFHSVGSGISATNEMENKFCILSNFNEETAYTHQSTDLSSEAFSDAHSAPFTDSFSDEWNSYESANAGDDVEDLSSVREDRVINPSETSEFSKYGYLLDLPGSGDLSSVPSSLEGLDEKDKHLSGNSSGVQKLNAGVKSSGGPIGKKNHFVWQKVEKDDVGEGISDLSASSLLPLDEYPLVEESRKRVRKRSPLPSVLPVKSKQKDKNLSENSISGRRLSLGGGVSGGPIGKENQLVWQKVQKDDVGEGVSNSSASSGLQFDSSPKDAPLSNRVSNVLGSEEVVKSKDDSKPKALVSESVTREPTSETMQELNCGSITGSSDTTLARPKTTKMLYREALQHSVQVNPKFQRAIKRTGLEDRTGRSQTRTKDRSADKTNLAKPANSKMPHKEAGKLSKQAHLQNGFSSKSSQSSMVGVNVTVPVSNPEIRINASTMQGSVLTAASNPIGLTTSKPVPNAETGKDESKVLQDVIKTASHPIDCKANEPVANLEICKDGRSELGVCATVSPQGDCEACEQYTDSNISEDERNMLQIVCTTVSDTNGKTLSSSTPEVADQSCSLSRLSEGCSPIPVTDTIIQHVEDSWAESGNQGHIFGSISEKRLPVSRQDDSGETGERTGENSLVSVDKSVSGELALQKHGGKKLNPDAHIFVPLYSGNVRNVGQSTAVPTPRDKNPILKNPLVTDRVHMEKLRALTTDVRCSPDLKIVKVESDKIVQAVGDAYRMEMTSTGVHLATSKPVAEFETFLHSASPVLGQTRTLHDCVTCSTDNFIGASLCMHEIPNASLGRLWQWYEEHSSFGLEVKTEDYLTSKFSAYYVPYLSGVQLFGNSRSTSDCSRRFSSSKALKALGKSRDDADLVTSSCLLPEHCGANQAPAAFDSPYSSSSVYGEDEFIDHSLESELLFEYYELEQPFHRQPLFDKIKDLVRGGGVQNCRTYGDPKKLESSNLQDLHPSSWYCIAWYPVYRIPGGKLKGAFLTYHSLGHFVRRCTTSDNRGGSTASIVSPVVGLQSFKTEGESWFKLKPPLMTQTQEEISNHAEILKERLRSLEKTSHVMARAVVNQGDPKLVIKQPDFEFFASRGGFR